MSFKQFPLLGQYAIITADDLLLRPGISEPIRSPATIARPNLRYITGTCDGVISRVGYSCLYTYVA